MFSYKELAKLKDQLLRLYIEFVDQRWDYLFYVFK